ncbi:RraA family protein [Halobacillus litoralis]|uniref:RraA family protein n=1 Tax=Halobacillus litoralis TaxID=45668 RepID=UPI0024922FEC|nr:RraA family protein [Halobacillus litoralis]
MKINAFGEKWMNLVWEQRAKKVEPATMGHFLHEGFMSPKVQALWPNVRVFGRAVTVQISVNDSTMVHKAVSLAGEGDVVVISRNGDAKHACVGEMVAYAAKARNIEAIVIDGPATDIQALREIGVPVFATGLSPITTQLLGQTGGINEVITCGNVVVSPGDYVTADENGVLVLEKTKESKIFEAIEKAEASEANEPIMKNKIDNGETLASLTKADELIQLTEINQ